MTTTVTEDVIRIRERARISSILTHDEAAGRTLLARHIALETSLELADAVEILQAARRVDGSTPPVPFTTPTAREEIFSVTRAEPKSVISFDVFERRRLEVEALRRRNGGAR